MSEVNTEKDRIFSSLKEKYWDKDTFKRWGLHFTPRAIVATVFSVGLSYVIATPLVTCGHCFGCTNSTCCIPTHPDF